MMLKIKKIVSILLGCICLVSASNAMNSANNDKLSDDDIAMQHTMLNIIQIQENIKNPAINNTEIGGISIDIIKYLFNITGYQNSPNGNARNFLNDLIAAMVNCNCEQINGLNNNEYYNKLKNTFNTIANIDYSNISVALGKMRDILASTRSIFFNMCKTIKNENHQEYNFINDEYNNENDYRTLQLKLAKTIQSKSELSKKPETEDLVKWETNEILLHRSLLLVLYCEKLIIDLSLFPKEFSFGTDISSDYWSIISEQFKANASSYFN